MIKKLINFLIYRINFYELIRILNASIKRNVMNSFFQYSAILVPFLQLLKNNDLIRSFFFISTFVKPYYVFKYILLYFIQAAGYSLFKYIKLISTPSRYIYIKQYQFDKLDTFGQNKLFILNTRKNGLLFYKKEQKIGGILLCEILF
jgi:ribosomal protein S8